MILSKGLTGGYTSFACAMYSRRLATRYPLIEIEPDTRTNGGHPLACASALAAIDYIEQHNLVELSRVNGGLLRHGLQRLALRYPHIIERSEEHTSELQSLMRISYAVFCLQ